MPHAPDFLAGLQKAAQACDDQAQKTGGVSDGAMSDDPAKLAQEAMSVGALNSAAAIRDLIEAPSEEIAGDVDNTETGFVRGLQKGASFCDEVAGQFQGMADSKFVTAHGKAVHQSMAQGAVAAGDAVRALIAAEGAPHAIG